MVICILLKHERGLNRILHRAHVAHADKLAYIKEAATAASFRVLNN